MYKYNDAQEMKRAINGKMLTMVIGLFLLFTGLTSTMLYGVQCVTQVKQISELADIYDTEEGKDKFAELTKDATEEEVQSVKDYLEGVKNGDSQYVQNMNNMTMAGIVFFVLAAIEVLVGALAIVFNNRLDKNRFLIRMSRVLILVEAVLHILLILMGANSLLTFIGALIAPFCLFWAVTRLKIVAKAHPDRIYAVEPRDGGRKKGGDTGSAKQSSTAAPARPQGKKSLMARATVSTVQEGEELPEEDEEEPVQEEIIEVVQTEAEAAQEENETTEEVQAESEEAQEK